MFGLGITGMFRAGVLGFRIWALSFGGNLHSAAHVVSQQTPEASGAPGGCAGKSPAGLLKIIKP